ncbi:kinesin motor domain protein [Teladorsagia circumcincta]|uniref:Kinesin-like protein n=1 Tax=Teladorsagia circumcincta TaxID=45464 RepID=A0A2G9UWV1_TELCI|nr:kinesin motor domain protein [Teladorsagia circumcincta]
MLSSPLALSGNEIPVFCRIRPLNKTEEKNGDRFLPKFPSEDTISIGGKVFVYDKVFKPNTTQEQVYMGAAYHIVQDVLSGYNGTVFAYGQTSSGKTHTMEGVIGDQAMQGIIPRIVQDIFNHIYTMDTELEFHIKVSYFEIYNEKIRDLLDPEKVNLSIHEDKNRVPYVKGATERFVGSPDEVLQTIEDGKSNRMVAVTNMNEHSSRSHSVFLITVKQEHQATKKQLAGKLYLVDLAGSEKVSKTGAQGTVLEEAKNINKSLTALGIVISALAEGTKSHVPYRDSKLTRILQESLGGNSRTTVIICASPSHFNEAETKSTLMFGQRAKTIKNVVQINEELTAEEWKRRYEKERDKNTRLSAVIQALNLEVSRWRGGERVNEADWINLNDTAGLLAVSDTPTDSTTPSMERSMIAPAPPMLTSVTGPITDEEKKKYEEERVKLYQQLDEKDDEIQRVSQEHEKLKAQVLLQDESIQAMRENEETLREELVRIQKESDDKQNETKEMISAIEDIAVQLEVRNAEYEKLKKELEIVMLFRSDSKRFRLQEENQQLEDSSSQATSALNAHLDECGPKIKHFKDAIYNIIREYNIADIVNQNDVLPDHELLNHMRIGVSKLFSENTAAKEMNSAEAQAAEKKLEEMDSVKGQDANKLKQLLMKDQAARELKPLTDRVNTELATLKNLKKEFVRLILSRCQAGLDVEEDCLSGPAQKQRIQFLENNLDKLTKVHKQLVRDNADLRVELPKMEARLRGREDRIKQLETALRETKERSQLERRKYQQEVERIKDAVRQRNQRRQNTPQIVKPIRPGQKKVEVVGRGKKYTGEPTLKIAVWENGKPVEKK